MLTANDFRSELTVELAFGKTIYIEVQREPVYMAHDEVERITGHPSDGWERFPDAVLVKRIKAELIWTMGGTLTGFRVPLSKEEAMALLNTTEPGRAVAAGLEGLKDLYGGEGKTVAGWLPGRHHSRESR